MLAPTSTTVSQTVRKGDIVFAVEHEDNEGDTVSFSYSCDPVTCPFDVLDCKLLDFVNAGLCANCLLDDPHTTFLLNFKKTTIRLACFFIECKDSEQNLLQIYCLWFFHMSLLSTLCPYFCANVLLRFLFAFDRDCLDPASWTPVILVYEYRDMYNIHQHDISNLGCILKKYFVFTVTKIC